MLDNAGFLIVSLLDEKRVVLDILSRRFVFVGSMRALKRYDAKNRREQQRTSGAKCTEHPHGGLP
jgi:hypothetical protein